MNILGNDLYSLTSDVSTLSSDLSKLETKVNGLGNGGITFLQVASSATGKTSVSLPFSGIPASVTEFLIAFTFDFKSSSQFTAFGGVSGSPILRINTDLSRKELGTGMIFSIYVNVQTYVMSPATVIVFGYPTRTGLTVTSQFTNYNGQEYDTNDFNLYVSAVTAMW